MKKVYSVKLKTLTPIHIGCDAVYEPMQFRMDENSSEMVLFDAAGWLAALDDSDRKRFSETAKKGTMVSLVELMKFVNSRPAEGRRVKVASGILENHKRVLNLSLNEQSIRREFNQSQIRRTSFRSTDNRPVIPGTAVKGAIRTAWLNAMQNIKQLRKDERMRDRDLQNHLMDYRLIAEDPFRLVKVSDFQPVGDAKTEIVYAVNFKRKGEQGRGVPQMLEVVSYGQIFSGTITVEEKSHERTPISNPVNAEDLLRAVAAFFTKGLERENQILMQMGNRNQINRESPMPICIGFHSGAENMTVEGHRNIRILGGRGRPDRFDSQGTTIWLTAQKKTGPGSLPMGWCGLEIMDDKGMMFLDADEKSWRMAQEQSRLARLDEIRDAEEKIREEQARLEAAAEARRLEEIKKQEEAQRLEALGPVDRAIAELESGTLSDDAIASLMRNELETSEPEDAKRLALALKACLEARGEWDVKKKAKAKFARKQKIRQVLGEI
ncbi:CRISPR type III-A-associated RAMP protein Csm5 [Desulfobotulus alkaliphilus]|uniref:CRISPR system Cms protein Csm5 n=1 Tax=Desulfobotulus alkaliphilus TaxID=622671 RepID=A0A562R6Y5_9BACT|nr:type III-A CRISPR-associated RAMP protein Csm5 [Desulfobotulus alkaliphilus]TWI64811.1 CRISPR type III-A-associated RAMP protein Csm5 [Desulfobotulus alkaliphilus]